MHLVCSQSLLTKLKLYLLIVLFRNENSKKEEYLQLVANYENYQKEANAFKFSGKKGDGDLANDLKSFRRCLDRSLFLVTKFNLGKGPNWTFPFALLNKDDQSLREVME